MPPGAKRLTQLEIYQTQKGELWHYYFEYGWKETPDHKIMVGYDEQQVWI